MSFEAGGGGAWGGGRSSESVGLTGGREAGLSGKRRKGQSHGPGAIRPHPIRTCRYPPTPPLALALCSSFSVTTHPWATAQPQTTGVRFRGTSIAPEPGPQVPCGHRPVKIPFCGLRG